MNKRSVFDRNMLHRDLDRVMRYKFCNRDSIRDETVNGEHYEKHVASPNK